VKDWKIKVLQLEAPQSEDYIVVRRLPCKLSDIEGILQDTLGVQHNKRILPNSILHLYWKVFDVVIYSQKFYDFSQPRFEYQHVNTYYFSQSSVTGGRTPNARSINEKSWDPLYEVYIQRLVPKPSQSVAYRFGNEQYLNFKHQRKQEKAAQGFKKSSKKTKKKKVGKIKK